MLVELEIDTKVPLRGCMSTLVIPDYDLVQPLSLGKNIVRFTPTKAGPVSLTCGMGAEMGKILVSS